MLDLGDFAIREYEPTDAAALVKYADNRRIWLNLRDRFPHPYTAVSAQRWLDQVALEQPTVSFAIATPKELIGGIGLVLGTDVFRDTAEIGYWLAEPFWNRGIATRAVGAFTAWAFEHHSLRRVFAGVFETNLASARVLEKCGYVREGRLRKSILKDGRVLDELLYAVVRPP
ncbi:MAG: GNAT family N-acetyltransferase [Candidatus Binatia bacterium]